MDMKKKRLRIHRRTLRMMNDPQYIYIWVNPEDKTLAICTCDKSSKDAVSIRYNRDCEIYSGGLFYELQKLNNELMDDRTYRLTGDTMRDNRVAVFQISEIATAET